MFSNKDHTHRKNKKNSIINYHSNGSSTFTCHPLVVLEQQFWALCPGKWCIKIIHRCQILISVQNVFLSQLIIYNMMEMSAKDFTRLDIPY